MKSPEKVLAFIEELQSFPDDEMAEALGLPFATPFLRIALASVGEVMPSDPAELDEKLTQVGDFCLSLRSDPETAEVADAAPA